MALLARSTRTGLLDHDGLTAFDVLDERLLSRGEAVERVGFRDLLTWGINDNYLLGHASPDNRSMPEKVGRFTSELRIAVDQVVSAKFHTVILADGQVFTCGFGR